MTSGVGHTVRSNGFGRSIRDIRIFVPNKVHRHHRIDQRFRSRYRAVRWTSPHTVEAMRGARAAGARRSKRWREDARG